MSKAFPTTTPEAGMSAFGATTGFQAVINEGADAPSDASTPYSIGDGDTFYGTLDEVTSETWPNDWIRFEIEAGQQVTFTMTGTGENPELDPYLVVLSASGGFLRSDGNFGNEAFTRLTFVAETAGSYFIKAESWDTVGGDYVVTATYDVAPPPPPPGDANAVDALDWGSQLASNTINVYFEGPSVRYFDGQRIVTASFNSYEKAQFRAVFDQIETVADVNFNVVTSPAQATFTMFNDYTGDMGSNALGFFYPPGEGSGSEVGAGVFNTQTRYWDRSSGGSLEQGGLGWQTIVHEILHGLGLAHPHDAGGLSERMLGVTSSFGDYGTYQLNQGLFTTMSYNRGYNVGATGTKGDGVNYEWGLESGPMALDIAVLQQKYGANETYQNGNSVYDLDGTNGADTYWKALWDTGGRDQIRYDGTTGATIDLRAATLEDEIGGGGFVSAVNGIAGGFTIAAGAEIENAMGGDGSDLITGNDLDNRLVGRKGNNTLNGGDGADTLAAGSGNDQMGGGAGNDEINGGAGYDTLFGGAGEDTLRGGYGNDHLLGNGNDDTVFGGRGRDSLEGGAGNDVMAGGEGADTLNGDTGADTLSGGFGRDSLDGGADDDLLWGNRGDDTLIGRRGSDLINAGAGNDTLNGGADNDRLNAGAGNDRAYGAEGNDAVRGGAGNDYLDGGENNDTLNGGAGNDTLNGGAGADVFQFKGEAGADIITDFADTTDVLHIHRDVLSGQSTGTELFERYGNFESGGLMFDFETGNSIFLENYSTLGQADSLFLVYG